MTLGRQKHIRTIREDRLPISATYTTGGILALEADSANLRALVKELQRTLQNVKNYDDAIKPKYQVARSLMREIDASLAKAREIAP